MNDAPQLPWPFKPGDVHPYLNVEIAPGEYVTVVLAGDYKQLIAEYLQLRDEHARVTTAAYEQIKAAEELIDVWRAYGHNFD
jgi:hypothetical protein